MRLKIDMQLASIGLLRKRVDGNDDDDDDDDHDHDHDHLRRGAPTCGR
jgi:hypothetical protein